MNNTSNVALCLHNHRKKLRTTLMQMSPPSLEPVSASVGVGDAIVDAGFISCVDHQPIATDFDLDVDPSSVEPEFMLEYEATFGDERQRTQSIIDQFLS
jgi:hypothetical protein